MARRALTENHKDVAAVLASAALEDALKRHATSSGLNVDESTMSEVISALKSKGLVSGAHKSMLSAMLQIRNLAMHAKWDNGCRLTATSHLRPYLTSHHYALVVFDRDGCGSERSRLEIQQEVDLSRNGWRDRSKAIVIDPEIEAWVWSNSPDVARALGWGSDFQALREWLGSQDLWASGYLKPQDPKSAMRKAMEKARLPKKARRSSSKFYDLATTVDFTGCDDPAFVELTRTLRAWFPPEAER